MNIKHPTTGIKRKLWLGGLIGLPLLGVGGTAYAASVPAAPPNPPPAATAPAVHAQQGTNTAGTHDAPDPSEAANSHETDGPGGHQDPPGAQVDHQFDGQE